MLAILEKTWQPPQQVLPLSSSARGTEGDAAACHESGSATSIGKATGSAKGSPGKGKGLATKMSFEQATNSGDNDNSSKG
eukprot:6162007-Alexandrium_andersonii.AAC.1